MEREKLSYAEAMNELESIVERVEQNAMDIDDLTERRCEYRNIGILLTGTLDHLLEGVDLCRNIASACLRALDTEAELIVLLISYKDIRNRYDLGE